MNNQFPELGCACATVRRAARLVTQLYSDEMRGTVDPPQFSLLTAIGTRPGIIQTQLGGAMGLDKTTVSRNLRVMRAYGWIAASSAGDRREKGYKLTPLGRDTLASAKPAWLRAQKKLQAVLKPGAWEKLFVTLNHVADAVDRAGTK